MIAINGAIIYDENGNLIIYDENGNLINSNPIDTSTINYIIYELKHTNFHFEIVTKKGIYSNNRFRQIRNRAKLLIPRHHTINRPSPINWVDIHYIKNY